MPKLEKNQIKRIKKVLNGQSVTILKTPLEKHQLLLHWNFDDGLKPFEHLVEDQETDLGTIVLLYWLLSPGYQYQALKKDPAFTLIKKIEANVKKDFYRQKTISVDPQNNLGTNFLSEPDNQKILKQIPQALALSSPGKAIAMLKLQPVYINRIYPLSAEDENKLKKQIAKGLAILTTINPQLNRDAKIEEIIDTIDSYTKSMRPKDKGVKAKFDRKTKNNFKCLDMVFGQQLVRKAGWQWYIHEEHEQVLDYREVILVSADKQYQWYTTFGFTEEYALRNYAQGFDINHKFKELLDIEAYRQIEIKKGLEFWRGYDQECQGKTDKELKEFLLQREFNKISAVPFYVEKFENCHSNEEREKIKAEIRSQAFNRVFSHVLPNSIGPCSYIKIEEKTRS